MSAPKDTLWPYEEHTQAKHRLLVGYLHAWYPIMASTSRVINVIDGFAGPGRYLGGEPGSPLLMIDAYVNHGKPTPAMARMTVNFDFIEDRPDRVAHLEGELAKLTVPPNVNIEPVHLGSFDAVMTGIMDGFGPDARLAPTFAFLDPFGYTGMGLELSSRILQSRKCEVLIYVPWPYIARFLDHAPVAPALDVLFGDSSWTAARGLAGKEAAKLLHRLFLERVERAAGFAVAFEIDATKGGKGWAGYTLYFGTKNVLALEKMKQAMWRIDPLSGAKFSYAVDPNQLTTFMAAPNLLALEAALRLEFGTSWFSIQQAERFTTVHTPFAAGIHLRRRTLKVAEDAGRIGARQPGNPKRRRGNYPDGTQIKFEA